MLKHLSAAYLVTTALTFAPALAQSNGSHPANNSQAFVTQAAEGGMFEVQSSQLALRKSQDKDIRDFAQKMIDDHTKANDQLKSLAKHDTVPSSLDQDHQQQLTKLQGADGSGFADQFKQAQVSAHRQATDLFQNYAQNGTDTSLKQFAQQTLPTLKHHLQMAEQITIASNDRPQQTAQAATSGSGGAIQSDGNRNYFTQQTEGIWRTSKLIGLGVYNEQNERVGDLNDVLVDRSGKAAAVVIGVGGFLGIGEHNVAVPYDTLKWSMTPATTSRVGSSDTMGNPGGATSPSPSLGSPASPLNPAPAVPPRAVDATRASDNQAAAYPDHAILPNASKDQLQKAPQFQYGAAPR